MMNQTYAIIILLTFILLGVIVAVALMISDKSPDPNLPSRGSICVFYQNDIQCVKYDRVVTNGN